MLDWWFDIDNRICCVRMDERRAATSAVFDGGIRAKLDGVRSLRTGKTYEYTVAENHRVSINDVKLKGERYVSLYCDGKLIKEYNVRAEYYKHKYGTFPEIYDRVGVFLRKTFFAALALAMFFACFTVTIMTGFSIFDTLESAGICAGALELMIFVFFFGLAAFRYGNIHIQMEKYSIISSVKKHRKPKRFSHRKNTARDRKID